MYWIAPNIVLRTQTSVSPTVFRCHRIKDVGGKIDHVLGYPGVGDIAEIVGLVAQVIGVAQSRPQTTMEARSVEAIPTGDVAIRAQMGAFVAFWRETTKSWSCIKRVSPEVGTLASEKRFSVAVLRVRCRAERERLR